MGSERVQQLVSLRDDKTSIPLGGSGKEGIAAGKARIGGVKQAREVRSKGGGDCAKAKGGIGIGPLPRYTNSRLRAVGESHIHWHYRQLADSQQGPTT